MGTKLTHISTVQAAIQAAGLNWTVAKKDLPPGQEHQPLKGGYVLVREDLWNAGKGGILGNVRADYTPLQNVEALSFLDSIVKTGAAFYDSIGALGQGEWVWIMLRFAGDLEIAPHDRVAKYLLFGTTPTTGYHRLSYLPVRLISKSTLSESDFHNPSPLITGPRVSPRRFEGSTEAALREIQRHFSETADLFRAMRQTVLDTERLRQYFAEVLDRWLKASALKGSKQSQEPIAGYDQVRLECTRLFTEGKGNDLPTVKGTLWAALWCRGRVRGSPRTEN